MDYLNQLTYPETTDEAIQEPIDYSSNWYINHSDDHVLRQVKQ